MSVCDPAHTGHDICTPWGNSTVGHIDCATAWSDAADFGQLDAGGCDVGCAPCLDYPSEIQHHADYRDGGRWCRPAGPTRDAMGRQHDLLTGEPWPLPRDAVYEWGACYHNTTDEQCFNRNVCRAECWRGGLDFIWADEQSLCMPGASVGDPVPMWFPDVLHFIGSGWPPSLYCRRFQDPPAVRTGIGARRLHRTLGPSFPRFGQLPFEAGRPHWPCAANILTPCRDRSHGSACPSGFANRPDPGDPHWVGDSACRSIWDTLRLDASRIRIARAPTWRSVMRTAVKNRALEYAMTRTLPGEPLGITFDRVDHTAGQAGGAIGLWRREYGIALDGRRRCELLEDPATVFMELAGRYAGRAVTVRAHILAVSVSVTMVLHRLARFVSSQLPDAHEVEPHVRALVGVEIAYTCIDPPLGGEADCWLVPEGLRIVDPEDRGRAWRPPSMVEWFGYLGALGIGGTHRYPVHVAGTLSDLCWSAADRLGRLTVAGWPARATLDDPPQTWPYVGSLDVWLVTRDEDGNRILC